MLTGVMTDEQVQNFIEMFSEEKISHYIRRKFHYQAHNFSHYEKAKHYQTVQRNLRKALKHYAKAAQYGEKVESAIKDFASVLHQCGKTVQAVKFLQKFKPIVKGGEKYCNLIENLRKQINPSGKFQYKKILLTKIPIHYKNQEILSLFQNPTRIQQIIFTTEANFSQPEINDNLYKYAVLTFDSFSAAKKTLQTFNFEQEFGIERYWVGVEDYVICQATNGRIDFDRALMRYQITQFNTIQASLQVPDYIAQLIPKKIFKRLSKIAIFEQVTQANESSILKIKQISTYYDKL